MQCEPSMINVLLDFFGNKLRYSKLENGKIQVEMQMSLPGAKLFALQYADTVEVLEPVKLREEIKETLQNTLTKYK